MHPTLTSIFRRCIPAERLTSSMDILEEETEQGSLPSRSPGAAIRGRARS